MDIRFVSYTSWSCCQGGALRCRAEARTRPLRKPRAAGRLARHFVADGVATCTAWWDKTFTGQEAVRRAFPHNGRKRRKVASQASGRTYGFGRVSGATRPSPYSPLHARSRMDSSPVQVAHRRARSAPRARLGSSMFAVLGGAVFGLTAWLWYFDGGQVPVAGSPEVLREPPPLSAEAQRLASSALVTHGIAWSRSNAPAVSAK